jgi:hypothetical protein
MLDQSYKPIDLPRSKRREQCEISQNPWIKRVKRHEKSIAVVVTVLVIWAMELM